MKSRIRSASGTRFWIDTRFVLGLLLVAASVAGVVSIVSAADTSVQVYAAREPLNQGDLVTVDDLRASSVRVADAGEFYLLEGEVPAEGLVVTKPVAAGELVPTSALGNAAGLHFGAVVVTVAGQLPGSIEPGSLVDLWSSRADENGAFGPPSVLVSHATIVRVIEDDGLVVDGSASNVELLVPRSKIARVLEAIANSSALSLVPVSIPAQG